eukprot:SAG11_NODE_371_length_10051_cov_5.987741_12_plen_47_part_00
MDGQVRGGREENFSAIVAECMTTNEVGGKGKGFPSLEKSKQVRANM